MESESKREEMQSIHKGAEATGDRKKETPHQNKDREGVTGEPNRPLLGHAP